MNNKSLEGWHIDPQVIGLRAELNPRRSLVFSYDHFVYSDLRLETDHDILEIHFATHSVVVKGHALKRIEHALQRRELGSLSLALDDGAIRTDNGSPQITALNLVSPTGAVPQTGE